MKKYDMNTIEGIDADLETSLLDYGLAWVLSEDETEYKFYYRVAGEAENSLFDVGFFKADLDVFSEFNWADFPAVFNYIGITKEEWEQTELPSKIFDLLQYYGYENIFGSSYGGLLRYNTETSCFVMEGL